MQFLYNFSIFSYWLFVRLGSLFTVKGALWINGRKDIFEKLKTSFGENNSKLVWVHCASLGEFEQGRPLIESIKKKDPNIKILLTFFSPSGYEIRKNYQGADHVFYLPLDSPSNAKKFIEIVKPAAVFFVKYEFWFNYLNELKLKNIPTYLVSGIFREDHYFFKNSATWARKQLACFTHFFLQDERSLELLNSIGYKNATVAGDTRFDRVSEISKNIKSIPLIQKFSEDQFVVIGGSTWEEDEKIVQNLIPIAIGIESSKLIVAPHEIDERHIEAIEAKFRGISLRYSNATNENVTSAKVLILDNIGMLSSVYQYGSIAFIGGGFGKGIHNILEAATFGLPVIFGPNYKKFAEAKELIKLGGAFSIADKTEFEKTMSLLSDKQVLQTASHVAKFYVQSRIGATEKILGSVKL